jgi:hypothetical protein
MALSYMLPCGNITPFFESNQVNYSRTGIIVAFEAGKGALFPFGNANAIYFDAEGFFDVLDRREGRRFPFEGFA